MKFLRLFVLAAATFAVTSVASAQVVETGRSGIPRQNLVSANPIGLLFEWYNGEYERAISPTASFAVAASSFGDLDDFDNERYSVLDAIGRYYPSARALRGFSIGVSAGLVNFSTDYDYEGCPECDDDEGTFGTLGIRGDYVWILGRDQRFAVATGLGAKRILGGGDLDGLPIGRLSIGWAW
jgi:hypothetical protein